MNDDYGYRPPKSDDSAWLIFALIMTVLVLPIGGGWVILSLLLHHPAMTWAKFPITLFDWHLKVVWHTKIKLPAHWHFEAASVSLIFVVVSGVLWLKGWSASDRRKADREGLAPRSSLTSSWKEPRRG